MQNTHECSKTRSGRALHRPSRGPCTAGFQRSVARSTACSDVARPPSAGCDRETEDRRYSSPLPYGRGSAGTIAGGRTRVRARRAVTLIELLIVIVLIGVLAAFLWPDFGILMRSEQLDESAQRNKALIGMCRAQAMNESRRYRVTLLPDGRMLLSRQRDPLLAPEEFVQVDEGWARVEWLLEDVWVAAVLPLPDGPPPLNVEDDKIEFFEIQEFPEPLENPFNIEFEADGTCTSLRWVLRDESGHGRELTLDGRLGHVTVVELPPMTADEIERPAAQPEYDDLVVADPGVEP